MLSREEELDNEILTEKDTMTQKEVKKDTVVGEDELMHQRLQQKITESLEKSQAVNADTGADESKITIKEDDMTGEEIEAEKRKMLEGTELSESQRDELTGKYTIQLGAFQSLMKLKVLPMI